MEAWLKDLRLSVVELSVASNLRGKVCNLTYLGPGSRV